VAVADGGSATVDGGVIVVQGPPGSPDTPEQVRAKLEEVDGVGSGLDSDLLQGMPPSAFQRAVTGACSAGATVQSINADGTVSCAGRLRTVIVSPAGSASENGQALLDALAGLSGASANNPWLVVLEPGRYDVNGELVVPSGVTVQGSGEDATTLIVANNMLRLTPALAGDVATLRDLTVQSSGEPGAAVQTAGDGRAVFSHVTVDATSIDPGSEFGISATSALELDGCTVSAQATGDTSVAVYTIGQTVIRESHLTANGGGAGSGVIISNGWTRTPTASLTVVRSDLHSASANYDGVQGYLVNVADTQFDTPAINMPSGGAKCFGNYNATFAAVSCQ
jgi:hypothetical protein